MDNRPSRRLKGSASNKINTADIAKAKANTNSRGFAERLDLGTKGEYIVKEFLLKSNYNYIDCTKNSKILSKAEIKAYEQAEIDLIVESQIDYTQKTVEVKSFTKSLAEKPYLCIKVSTEYIDEEQKTLRKDDSFLYRTKAEYFFFVCLTTKNIYSIKVEDLRRYIEENTEDRDKVYFTTYKDDKDKNHKYDRYNKCAYVNTIDLIEKRLMKKMTKIEA